MSSPHFAQLNGMVEHSVHTIKQIFKNAKVNDSGIDLALLEFHNTPISGMAESPAQLLIGRNLCSSLLMTLISL